MKGEMMNRGMATVWVVLTTVLVMFGLGAVGYVLYTQQTPETATTPPSTPSAAQDEEPFTVIGKRPYSANADLYRGYVIVEGEYSMNNPFELTFGPGESSIQTGEVLFEVDQAYRDNMPKAFDEPVDFFIIPNTSAAVVLLMGSDPTLFNDKTICKLSGKAKIALSDFEVSLLEGGPGIGHHGTLAKVFSTTKPTVEKCE